MALAYVTAAEDGPPGWDDLAERQGSWGLPRGRSSWRRAVAVMMTASHAAVEQDLPVAAAQFEAEAAVPAEPCTAPTEAHRQRGERPIGPHGATAAYEADRAGFIAQFLPADRLPPDVIAPAGADQPVELWPA